MTRRYKEKKEKEDDGSNSLIVPARSLRNCRNLCDLVSGPVSDGVEKCMDVDHQKDV